MQKVVRIDFGPLFHVSYAGPIRFYLIWKRTNKESRFRNSRFHMCYFIEVEGAADGEIARLKAKVCGRARAHYYSNLNVCFVSKSFNVLADFSLHCSTDFSDETEPTNNENKVVHFIATKPSTLNRQRRKRVRICNKIWDPMWMCQANNRFGFAIFGNLLNVALLGCK